MVATLAAEVVIPVVHQEVHQVVTQDPAQEVILEVVTQALLLPHNKEVIQAVPHLLRAVMEAPLRDRVDTVLHSMGSHKWTPALLRGLGRSTR